MRKSLRFALVLLALAQQLPAQNTSAGEQSKSLIDQASRAMRLFRQTDPSMKRFFFRSVGWAVYPRVANAGVLLGGAYGKGVVYQRGVIIGFSELRQFTARLQLGGRQYSEIVFFADKPTLQRFRQGRIKIDPDTQGIRTARGNAADARPRSGVTVFLLEKGGLMADISFGRQRLSFEPRQAFSINPGADDRRPQSAYENAAQPGTRKPGK